MKDRSTASYSFANGQGQSMLDLGVEAMTHVPREVDARLVNETVPFNLRLLAWLWPSEALYIRRNAIPQLLGNLRGIVRSSITYFQTLLHKSSY